MEKGEKNENLQTGGKGREKNENLQTGGKGREKNENLTDRWKREREK